VEVANWHRSIEEKLAASGPEYCNLRPYAFMQNWLRKGRGEERFWLPYRRSRVEFKAGLTSDYGATVGRDRTYIVSIAAFAAIRTNRNLHHCIASHPA
jgi:uncharacterized protein YbjT (DUF2867 family)